MAAGATRPRPVASSVPAAEAPPLPELSEERKVDLAELLRAPQPDDAATVELLLNPTPDSAGAVTAMMETARAGPPRYDCFISTGVAPAFAFSAFRHRNAEGGFQYDVRLTPTESSRVGTNSFCAQLKCSADCTRYTLCDDPSNFYSYPRELGAVFVGGAGLGNRISVLVPRVLPSGAAAQFRVLRPEDGIISRFLAGQAREHIMTLSGLWTSKEAPPHAPPRLASPRLASPRLASPRLASPHASPPPLASPHAAGRPALPSLTPARACLAGRDRRAHPGGRGDCRKPATDGAPHTRPRPPPQPSPTRARRAPLQVFRATQSSSTLSLQYSSPLSCFQADATAPKPSAPSSLRHLTPLPSPSVPPLSIARPSASPSRSCTTRSTAAAPRANRAAPTARSAAPPRARRSRSRRTSLAPPPSRAPGPPGGARLVPHPPPTSSTTTCEVQRTDPPSSAPKSL